MALHPIVRPLGLGISFIGLIQAIAWFIMSFIAILMYSNVIEFEYQNTFADKVNYCIDIIYFQDESVFKDETGTIVDGTAFFSFVILYMLLSLAWMGCSGFQFKVLMDEKWVPVKISFSIWCAITGVVSLLDIILLGLIGSDYGAVMGMYNRGDASVGEPCLIAMFLVMTLAARGYVLWVLNVASIGFVILSIIHIEKQDAEGLRPLTRASAYSREVDNWFSEVENRGDSMPRMSNIDDVSVGSNPVRLQRSVSLIELNRPKYWSDDPRYTQNYDKYIPRAPPQQKSNPFWNFFTITPRKSLPSSPMSKSSPTSSNNTFNQQNNNNHFQF